MYWKNLKHILQFINNIIIFNTYINYFNIY